MGAQAREEAAPRHRAPPPAGAAAPEQALHKAAGALRPPPPCIGASRAPDLARVMGLFLGSMQEQCPLRGPPDCVRPPRRQLWVGRGRRPGVTPAPQSLSGWGGGGTQE